MPAASKTTGEVTKKHIQHTQTQLQSEERGGNLFPEEVVVAQFVPALAHKRALGYRVLIREGEDVDGNLERQFAQKIPGKEHVEIFISKGDIVVGQALKETQRHRQAVLIRIHFHVNVLQQRRARKRATARKGGAIPRPT